MVDTTGKDQTTIPSESANRRCVLHKADTLSITAWQIGMYGFMAFAGLYLFRQLFGLCLEVNSS